MLSDQNEDNAGADTLVDTKDPVASDSSDTHLKSSLQTRGNSSVSRKSTCQHGLKCHNYICRFDHPLGWDPCEDGEDCDDFDCKANHPYKRLKPCRNGARCTRVTICKFLHPVRHGDACPAKVQCRTWNCTKWHPKKRLKDCPFRQQCYNNECKFLHPPGRQLCPEGVQCSEFDCPLDHPFARTPPCNRDSACDNFFCTFLHPSDWDPCEQGRECENPLCSHTNHPSDRILRPGESANGSKRRDRTEIVLKSIEQRQREREQASLPILVAKKQFCQRLEAERLVVITAETGSGKSTQLPQYAAEHFGGLVVCTQPRVIAAISLARRVATEYDGTSVGHSVGYRVGHASMSKDKNRVPGADIVFMTDGAFIQESQIDARLDEVRVLIIDEVHERSLNTDIVMGIAKRLLSTRPNDFYVVICSATIETEKFLEFFQRTDTLPLKVPGRVYPVDFDFVPKAKESTKRYPESTENYAVSTVLKLYDQYEGNVLVFLPGQREIENAIELFHRKIPDNCIAFPLYSSLSPEEQDQVLKFHESAGAENRMVVFSTNIAETSLTIQNVRLVIDSGLVNEGYFDYENRLNVIESLVISRASAEQRRGRAGRMAPGYCVHLYDENDLRPDTKPQILRSSLDLVVLQLISLRLNPQEFSFMDPPDEKHIQASLDLLKDLSCTDTAHVANRKGELFAKLGIDPRYSAFLLDTYLEHGPILELAATVVAISIAPSSVFSINGETKTEKDAARDRIAKNAQNFDSDLFYIVSVYKGWHSVGTIDPDRRTCRTCPKSYSKGNICGSCRAAYSTTHLLNNKTFNYIENMSEEMMATIEDSRWELCPNSVANANESAIIGANLLKYFPERCGRWTAPRTSKKDIHMIKGNFGARLSEISAFFERRDDHPYVIAMSVTKIPGGAYIVDRLHPCSPPPDIREDDKVADN